jgi:hypothetical protein
MFFRKVMPKESKPDDVIKPKEEGMLKKILSYNGLFSNLLSLKFL